MQAYDATRFDPPAPLAFVTIKSHQLDIVIHDVPMLIDTGADVSLLPQSHIAALTSPGAKTFELEAFDGTRSTAHEVTAELQFLGKSFRGQFLLIKGSYGILGRNILNNLSLVFDGPALRWGEHR